MEQLNLSETEWKQRLTPPQYHVLREAGTERAYAGALTDNKAEGVYRCAACGLDLFDSADKFDSGSGWPSFTQPIAPDHVTDHADRSHGMVRTETRCARCDSHQGHVFPDGPPPTGLRYCINSISLDFNRAKQSRARDKKLSYKQAAVPRDGNAAFSPLPSCRPRAGIHARTQR